jgi:bacteriorhodopsin
MWASRSSANRVEVGRDHTMLAGYVNILWLLYPIAFAVSDGGNVIGVTQSLIFFGILDLLLVCGTAFAFLFLARKWDYGRMNLHFTRYGRVSGQSNGVYPEKGHIGTHAPAIATTATPATQGEVVNPPA